MGPNSLTFHQDPALLPSVLSLLKCGNGNNSTMFPLGCLEEQMGSVQRLTFSSQKC